MGKEYIENIRNQISDNEKPLSNNKESVFHHLLASDIPESEKSTAHLQAESMVILIAGTVTSAHTLSMIVYHVLSDPRKEKRLREDLREVMACYPAQNPRWVDLGEDSISSSLYKRVLTVRSPSLHLSPK